MLSSSPGYLIIKKNRLMYYIKGGLYTDVILGEFTENILKENFQKPMCWIFCFFSYSCQVGLIQIGLN